MERVATPVGGLAVPAVVAWPLVLAGVAGLLWGAFEVGRTNTPQPSFTSTGPRIEDVRKIAKLAVLRVQVANVIEGNTAGARAAVLVKGDADIAVDLDQVEITARDEQQKTATLLIPAPRPDRPRVDHARTKIYQLEKTGLAAINPFADPRADLLADAMRAAQQEVERAVADVDFIARAKEQTELLLTSFYAELGWKIAVQWK
jgi:hypothetical protein